MNSKWTKIIKKTGISGLIAFLFFILMKYIFSTQMIEIFGSEKLFIIVLVSIVLLTFALMLGISNESKTSSKNSKITNSKTEKKDIHLIYKDEATHNGDNNF